MSSELICETNFYSVSELNAQSRHLLESTFGFIWVKGELSNLSCPKSGHWYFTLKDSGAQVRCAMFKGANIRVTFTPLDGMEIMVFAKVSLYPDRGDYQLIVEQMQTSGDGQLRQAFELLKNKLAKEGLFDEHLKKPLPLFPNRIGVITSSTGAALQDIISVLKRRYPHAPLYIYPCQVQGQAAAGDIVKAIELANAHNACDVLIIARGGGSLEDLWPFNEEIVARAIFKSELPIISGVGHEIDFTITDFVADHRAPTPSAAAETVSPDRNILFKQINYEEQRLNNNILRLIQTLSQKVDYLEKCLISPGQNLKNKIHILNTIIQRLEYSIKTKIQKQTHQFEQLAYALGMVNPFATLKRGYSITYDLESGHILSDIQNIKPNHKLKTRLQDGWVISEVIETAPLESVIASKAKQSRSEST